jgi:hypothetical protein
VRRRSWVWWWVCRRSTCAPACDRIGGIHL